MDTFTIELSLSLSILELSQKISLLDNQKRNIYLEYIKDEFFAIDDEYSSLFEIIIQILFLNNEQNRIEIYLCQLSERKVNLDKLELCIKSCLDYLQDFD